MFCRMCGKQILDDSKFCQHCGVATSNTNIDESLLKKEITITPEEAKTGVKKSICFNGFSPTLDIQVPKLSNDNLSTGVTLSINNVTFVEATTGKKAKKNVEVSVKVKS